MKKWIIFSVLLLLSAGLSVAVWRSGEEKQVEDFYMTARLFAVGDRLEVEVSESENGMIGPFWVITPSETVYFGREGKQISREALCVGDLLRIRFGGQVMMSYPPQIVASEIYCLSSPI